MSLKNNPPYFSALAPLSIPIICQLNQDTANKAISLHYNSKLDCFIVDKHSWFLGKSD